MVKVSFLSVSEFWVQPNAEALLSEYADECAIVGLPRPNPSRVMYDVLESSGFMHMIGAFDEDGLIGFVVLLVYLNPHYGQLLAVAESLFVGASYRKTGAGMQLIGAAERKAHELGAIGIVFSAPTGSRAAEVLSRSGRCEASRSYFKGLQHHEPLPCPE